MTILDCTIRDGGNYNDWHFTTEFVRGLFSLLDQSCVDFIEVGYLLGSGSAKGGSYGSSYYCAAEYLETLPSLAHARYAIMVVPGAEKEKLAALRRFSYSGIALFRIATYLERLSATTRYLEEAKAKGALVSLNIMGISHATTSDLERIRDIACQCPIDVLYFADSFGHLRPEDIRALIAPFLKLREEGTLAIGFHGHDNIGLAMANYLAARNAGASFFDASVCGLARGAGNLSLEHLYALRFLDQEISKESVVHALQAAEFVAKHVLQGNSLPRGKREIICGITNEHYFRYQEAQARWDSAGISVTDNIDDNE